MSHSTPDSEGSRPLDGSAWESLPADSEASVDYKPMDFGTPVELMVGTPPRLTVKVEIHCPDGRSYVLEHAQDYDDVDDYVLDDLTEMVGKVADLAKYSFTE